MNSTAPSASRFQVVHITTPGTYYDTVGRYGIADSEHPGMGVFCSGIPTAAKARKIARDYNAR